MDLWPRLKYPEKSLSWIICFLGWTKHSEHLFTHHYWCRLVIFITRGIPCGLLDYNFVWTEVLTHFKGSGKAVAPHIYRPGAPRTKLPDKSDHLCGGIWPVRHCQSIPALIWKLYIYISSVFCYDKHKKNFDIHFSMKRQAWRMSRRLFWVLPTTGQFW